MKICTKCEVKKTAAEFYTSGKYLAAWCKVCARQRQNEVRIARRPRLIAENRCLACMRIKAKNGKCLSCCAKYRTRHKARWAKRRGLQIAQKKGYWHKARTEAIAAYGGKCRCCGVSDYEFLQLHHAHKDGGKHRRELRSNRIAVWARQNNYPAGYLEVVCGSCHNAITYFGYCPHEKRLQVVA